MSHFDVVWKGIKLSGWQLIGLNSRVPIYTTPLHSTDPSSRLHPSLLSPAVVVSVVAVQEPQPLVEILDADVLLKPRAAEVGRPHPDPDPDPEG